MAGARETTLSGWVEHWEVRKRPLCELLWVWVPLLAQRVSARLAAVTLDGGYLAARPGWGAALPLLVLFCGILAGAFHPGFEGIFYESWIVLIGLLVVAALSGYLGLCLVIGFVLGDLLFGAPTPAGAASLWSAPFAMGLPLLVEYLVIGIFAAQLAPVAKGLARQVPLPEKLSGQARFSVMAVIEAFAAAFTTAGWIAALPIVLRPRFTWAGISPPGDALETMQERSLALAGLVFAVTLLRVFLQHRAAFSDAYRSWFDHLDRLRQSVPAADQPLVERIDRRAMIALQAIFATLMLIGLIEGVIDAVLALAVIGAVQAARSGVWPVLGRWPEIADRVPALVRAIGGAALLAVLGPILLRLFFAAADGMRPMLFITLLSLVVFLLLLPPKPEAAREPAEGAGP